MWKLQGQRKRWSVLVPGGRIFLSKKDCGYVGCSRYFREHALKHFDETNHSITINIGTGLAWCYLCDEEVDNDHISDIRSRFFTKSMTNVKNAKRGLVNLGNTCYLNSAVQVLLACPHLEYYLLNCLEESANHRISQDLKHILLNESNSSIIPRKLVRDIKALNPMFRGYAQHDSHEFLRFILDRLSEETKYEKDVSFIDQVFKGEMKSTVTCLGCQNISIKRDSFFDLSLPVVTNEQASGSFVGSILSWISSPFVQTSSNLEECLEAFCEEEILSGKNQYYCEKCKCFQDCKKSLHLLQSPEILVLQLKRFRFDSFFSRKVSTHVRFPFEDFQIGLDSDESSTDSPDSCTYDLVGFVSHSGSMSGGHYVAYCRDKDNEWLKFDDDIVTQVDRKTVEIREAYILFYSKKQSPRTLIPDTSGDDFVYVSSFWWNRFKHFSVPGKVDSSDIACPHKELLPNRHFAIQKISKSSIEQLINIYGSEETPFLASDSVCSDCERNEKELQRRRKAESDMINELDSNSSNIWYLISTEWLKEWHNFQSGGDLPGEIDNRNLFEEDSKTLRQNLRKGIHYRGVNETVWKFLFEAYGGGPEIKREKIDIYLGK